ncbi:MAG TPA: nucleotidyltransferase family protein [Gemmataceae bacterium]|jgi:bifunctional UDP-N-acetylglucosamine pyrophosphorylase/glucosamine-1-phosphate N-acetyltransferase
MDAIILAAGLGTRLRPHTLQTPKPLLLVQGRPILDWTLGALPPEVDRVLVVTHYLSEQVEDYLRGQKHFSQWRTVRQENPRGTGDAVLSCREQVRSERFLVLNGDDLFGAADLAKLASCSAGVLCQPVDQPRQFGIAFRKPDGTLERLVEKPDLDGRQLANTGAYVFPRGVFDIPLILSPRNEYEVTQYIDELATKQTVQVVEAMFWLPISTVEVWQAAQTRDLQALQARKRQ